eukprot:4426458-Pleurochrysis_carterae.AAC.4
MWCARNSFLCRACRVPFSHATKQEHTDQSCALFYASCCNDTGDITAAASNSWCTALRDRLWQDYDVPADCLPWLLSLAFALEFFPRPLVIGDCNRFGNDAATPSI